VLLFVLYFSTAHLGLNIHAVNSFATLVWIPSGLALAFLFRFGLKYWPAVTLAAFAVNFLNDAPAAAALGISIGNTLEPVVGTILL
jgi:integral membrane sensor domain MASE1